MTGNPESRRARVSLAAFAGAGARFALGPDLASGLLPSLPDDVVGFGPPWLASRAFLRRPRRPAADAAVLGSAPLRRRTPAADDPDRRRPRQVSGAVSADRETTP